MPYTRAQLLAAVKKDHPEFANVEDNKLFAAIAVDHPDIAKGISDLQPPPSDDRSAGQVALDQTKSVATGVGKFVTGIPGMVADTAKLGYDALSGDTMGALKRARGMGEGLYKTVTDPMVPILETAAGGTASRQQWEQGAEAAGANLAGLVVPEVVKGVAGKVSKAATPERLQTLANDARAYREATSNQSTFPSRAGVFKSAVTGTKRAAAGVAAPVLEKAAKIRAGRPLFEGKTYAPETSNVTIPEKEPVGNIESPAAMRQDQYTPQYSEKNVPLTPNEPVNIPRPPQVDARSQEFLRRLEEPDLGAPDQYTPQYTEPEPLTPNEPVNIPRPGLSPNDQDFMRSLGTPETPQFENPIQQLTPEEQGVIAGISKGGKSVPLSGKAGNLAIQNAPYLLEVLPELKGTPPGAMFDGKLFNGFKRIGHELRAAEASIPDSTPVATADAVKALEAIQQDAAASLQNKAVTIIERITKRLKEKPTIEWKDFIEAKRGFDAEVGVDTVTGNKIYQIFKETANKVSPELGKLNQQYYTTRIAMDLAKMNMFKGLRLAEVAEKAKGIRRK